ncbi:hypothetical protein [Bowmanella pacifica]|uniref:3-oxoacyl-ACP synthase n=1 Tax=Bowmanella pacifica TaxID=502051 RepID=A0A917YU66_9ALTE|nr:hypothetical protein [Bowmanella pacifica]GGO66690.1 3-oxoacyl-ACP synthase [Bowmanella pacifica]
MSDRPLAVVATGMVTGVGLDTLSSCAAIRAAIDNFQETRFLDKGGEWLLGCEVPLASPIRGTDKLAHMLAMVILECSESQELSIEDTPVIICLADIDRPGTPPNQGNRVYFKAEQLLETKLHPDSAVIKAGNIGAIAALKKARDMLYQDGYQHVIVVGVDSLLNMQFLRHMEDQDRLLTSEYSDGFIPGEAAAALLLERAVSATPQLQLTGLGFGTDLAILDSELPQKAEGLTIAATEALTDANLVMDDMDFRIADISGDSYSFKDAALLSARLLRTRKQQFPLWHPTDCIGEVGAAIGPVCIAYLYSAFHKGFSAGQNVLMHLSNDDGQRAAAILQFRSHT